MFCYNNTSACSGDMFLQHGATRLKYHNTPTTRQRVFRTRLCVFRTHTSVSKTRLQYAKFFSTCSAYATISVIVIESFTLVIIPPPPKSLSVAVKTIPFKLHHCRKNVILLRWMCYMNTIATVLQPILTNWSWVRRNSKGLSSDV